MTVKYGEATAMPAKQDGKNHPEPRGDEVVRDGCDGGEFHTGLVVGSGGGPLGCAFEECELKAACAAYGVKMLPLWCEIVLARGVGYGERIRGGLMGDLGGIGRILVAFSNRGGRKPRRRGKMGRCAASGTRCARRESACTRKIIGNPPCGGRAFGGCFRSLDGRLHGGGTAEGGRGSRRCQSRAGDHSRGLHRSLYPGLQGSGRPAETLHYGGGDERNREIEEDGEKASKRHDEREHQPVVHNDQVRAEQDEIGRRDRHEQRVADRLDHDVHEANGDVPEQHGERGDAELEAQGLRIGKEEEADEKRRNGDQSRDGEFLKEAEKDEHEPPDALEEISDGGGHDFAEIRP